jgi:hypothetical protein
MAKYFCHQDTKSQRIFKLIQRKFFFYWPFILLAMAYKIDPPEVDQKSSIFNFQSSIPVYPRCALRVAGYVLRVLLLRIA